MEDSAVCKVCVFQGNQYKSTVIIVEEAENKLIEEANLSSYSKNGLLSLGNYPMFSGKLIDYYENNGFPFVEVYLDSLSLHPDSIISRLIIDKHDYITFDSIILQGDVKLSGSFLYPYLGLKKTKI
jgi:hypothetical protein